MGQKGFTLIEVILGLAIFALMVGVIGRSVVSINDLYKGGQLIKDLTVLREAIQNYYTVQGEFPPDNDINYLKDFLPAEWVDKDSGQVNHNSPFGEEYKLDLVGSIARIETPITDTINTAHLPNTYTYTSIGGAKYVRSDIAVPQQNFGARWERKYLYETTQQAP